MTSRKRAVGADSGHARSSPGRSGLGPAVLPGRRGWRLSRLPGRACGPTGHGCSPRVCAPGPRAAPGARAAGVGRRVACVPVVLPASPQPSVWGGST